MKKKKNIELFSTNYSQFVNNLNKKNSIINHVIMFLKSNYQQKFATILLLLYIYI